VAKLMNPKQNQDVDVDFAARGANARSALPAPSVATVTLEV